jgi:hypothetical protein
MAAEVKQCSYCKNEKDKTEFLSVAGRELKMCKRCREIKKKNNSKKCPHDKRKADCFECKGSRMCLHGVHKYWCLKCDPVKARLKIEINDIKQFDKRYNLYDADKFIDYHYIYNMYQECDTCYTCHTKITIATCSFKIKRIDPTIGHIKSNVILVCSKC